MAEDRDLRPNVASYLKRHGWTPGQAGQAGELWRLNAETRESGNRLEAASLAVPFQVEFDSFEYRAILDRLARQVQVSAEKISEAVESEFLDAQNYRIADQYVFEESALLEGAATVLGSARRLVRAAATTARKPRAFIGANFSKPGDEMAKRARLAHTRQGSFILPIVMPVTPMVAEGELEEGAVPIEPGERSVTHTLASALAALNNIAVKPETSPGPDDVMNLVQSGVSKELVSAVREIVVSAGVAAFDVSFVWSPALGTPKEVPERVVIADEAAPLLNRVAVELAKVKPEPDASVSGQIVRIHYVQGEPSGQIAIRTERRNRIVDVSVHAISEIVHQAYVWAHDHRAVLARGRIERKNDKTLYIPEPTAILPIDQLFADQFPAEG